VRTKGLYDGISIVDEVEMMESRTECCPMRVIAVDAGISEKRVREILDDPRVAAMELFFSRNGYWFRDDQTLSVGKTTVADIIKLMVMKYNNCTIERMAHESGYTKSYVEQVIYGKRGSFKAELAAQYMENRYGKGWRTW